MKNDVLIKEHERVDDLHQGGLRILQSERGFRFGMDAVLLAYFADVRPGDCVADLGTGTGVIPLLLAARGTAGHITALDIQPDVADMAARSVCMNGLQDKITVLQGDLRVAHEQLGYNRFDVVTCNPPYERRGSGVASPLAERAIARHEQACTLGAVAKAAFHRLRQGGRLALIIRADRAVDTLLALKQARMEPKRICMVHPSAERAPNLMLVQANRGGRPGVKWDPPIFVYGPDGAETPQLKRIYGKL